MAIPERTSAPVSTKMLQFVKLLVPDCPMLTALSRKCLASCRPRTLLLLGQPLFQVGVFWQDCSELSSDAGLGILSRQVETEILYNQLYQDLLCSLHSALIRAFQIAVLNVVWTLTLLASDPYWIYHNILVWRDLLCISANCVSECIVKKGNLSNIAWYHGCQSFAA